MKSGNSYYVDVSEYSYENICEQLSEAILYGDNYLIDANGKTYFFKGEEIEYFELEITDIADKTSNKIGFELN